MLNVLGPVTVYRTVGAGWPTDAAGELAARQTLGTTPRPTALLALTDLLALDAAHQMGLRVPDDVSITGLDDLPGSDLRGLTTALVPYRPMGELAGRILMARIGGQFVHEPPPFPAPVAMRATTAVPPV